MSTPETPTPAAAATQPDAPDGRPADRQDERLIADRGGVGGWAAGDLGRLAAVTRLLARGHRPRPDLGRLLQHCEPAFLSSRNLVNLTLQMVAVGTIAIGVVLVLLLGEIDLSIGSMAGLSAAILAVLFVSKSAGVGPSRSSPRSAAGAVVGLVYGFLYNRFGVPSFVISLAGLLALLGLQLRVLGDQGTINLPFESSLVRFASQQFLPAMAGLHARHRCSRRVCASRRCAATPVGPRPACRSPR